MPKIYLFLTALLVCLKGFQESETTTSDVSMRFISYNVSRIFLFEKSYSAVFNASAKQLTQAPDILVIVFQERLGLPGEWIMGSSYNGFFFGRKPAAQIKGYELVAAKDDLQTEMLIYRRTGGKRKVDVGDIKADSCIDRNIKYIMSSKGTVSITMTIDSTVRVQFLGTHLHAYLGGVRQRKELMEDINKELIAENPAHYHFMVGDLNYRLDRHVPDLLQASEAEIDEHYLPYEYSERLSKENVTWFYKEFPKFRTSNPSRLTDTYQALKKYDQLPFVIYKNYTLAGFKESNIKFQPTYKVHKYKDQYKTERTVSWTDRFIWRPASSNLQKHLKHGAYEVLREQPINTDHLPIVKELTVQMAPFKQTLVNISKLSTLGQRATMGLDLTREMKDYFSNKIKRHEIDYNRKPNVYLAFRSNKGHVQRVQIEDITKPVILGMGTDDLSEGLDNKFGLLRIRVYIEFYSGANFIDDDSLGSVDIFLDQGFVEGNSPIRSHVFMEHGKRSATLKMGMEIDVVDK